LLQQESPAARYQTTVVELFSLSEIARVVPAPHRCRLLDGTDSSHAAAAFHLVDGMSLPDRTFGWLRRMLSRRVLFRP
jgi:hypothetical protein